MKVRTSSAAAWAACVVQERVVGVRPAGTAKLLACAENGVARTAAEIAVDEQQVSQLVEITLERLDRISFVATTQHHRAISLSE